MTKISTVCIDTLTQIQENQFMLDKKKPGHDKWKDYSQDIYKFILDLQELGFEIALIVGPPGVGKSTGMRNLPSKTNIWYNADNKNPVYRVALHQRVLHRCQCVSHWANQTNHTPSEYTHCRLALQPV